MSTTSEKVPQPPAAETTPLWPSLTTRRRLWLLYAVAWTIALEVPVPIKPRDPGWVEPLFTFSKTVHVGAYVVFTGLSAWMLLPVHYRWLLPIVLLVHGMLSELAQFFLHDLCGRTGQWSDVGLDAIGIGLGLVLTCRWWFARTPG